MDALETTYLEALSELYPTASEAAEAAAMLEGVLALPRGTELFASDIHGEYNAFSHLLRNGSGAVRTLIADTFGAGLTAGEAAELAAVVAYPEEKALGVLGRAASDEAADAWLAATLSRLAALAHAAASRHGLAEVDALIPADFGAVAAALLAAQGVAAKAGTAAALIEATIEGGYGVNLAITLAELTRHLVVDQLHLIGDVYDRGPAPHLIMDELLDYPAVDVQWGNHDILWMGAAAGSPGSVANVVRICARYGNLSILEDAYGINLRPLASFAAEAYADDPCVAFALKGNPGLSEAETRLTEKIQKAMAII